MSYQHLSEKERHVISHLQSSFSLREIARRLGRHHSTISREFKREDLRDVACYLPILPICRQPFFI